MRHLAPRPLAPAAAVVLALAGIVVTGPPAGAVCPVTGCDGGDPTFTYTAQLTVSRTAGTVSSTTVGDHRIDCGVTCSVSDTQITTSDVRPTDGWPTYTLTASDGPAGYSPSWTGCGVAATCDVVNDQLAKAVALTWVDVTPPTVTFDPPARVRDTVSAGAVDTTGALPSFRWTVDGSLYSTTGSVLSLSSVAEGPHVVGVAARDVVGNLSDTVTRTVVLDRSVHQQVSTVPDFVADAPTLTFSTTDTDVVTFACSVDAAAFAPCASPWTPTVGEGQHEVVVRATDDLGNVAQQVRSFVVDQTPPELSLTDGPAEGAAFEQSSTSLTAQQAEEHPGTFECSLDGSPLACTPGSPVTLAGLAVGGHTFRVTATDQAGNVASLVRHFTRAAPAAQPPATSTPTASLRAPSRTAAGRRVVLRLSMSGSAGAVTGSVTWKVGRKVVCRTTLSGGQASCRTPRLRPGRQVVVAAYAGSASYTAISARRTIRVRR